MHGDGGSEESWPLGPNIPFCLSLIAMFKTHLGLKDNGAIKTVDGQRQFNGNAFMSNRLFDEVNVKHPHSCVFSRNNLFGHWITSEFTGTSRLIRDFK